MTEPNTEFAGTQIDWFKLALGLVALIVVSVAPYMGLRYLLEHRREAILLRMGRSNAYAVRKWLTESRAAVA